MEKDISNEEETICKYLYLLSSFLEYAEKSKEIFIQQFQNQSQSFEKLKPKFKSQNLNNEFSFLRSQNVFSMLKNNESKEIAKNEIFTKIKKEFNIDVSKKLNEEEIFLLIKQKLSYFENNFKDPFLIQIFAEKIYTLMVQSNNLFYFIFKSMKNKYEHENSKLNSELKINDEKNEKKIFELNSNNNLLQNEINSLKDLIKKNHDELMKTQNIIENDRKQFALELQKKTEEYDKKLQEVTEINKKEYDKKLQEVTEINKKEYDTKLQEVNEANKKEYDQKLQEINEANKKEYDQKLQEVTEINKKEYDKKLQEVIEINKKEYDTKLQESGKKIMDLEKKIEEITSNAKFNDDVIMFKYREALDINLNYMKREKDIKGLFQDYSKTITDLLNQNNKLEKDFKQLKISRDQLEIENEGLRNYIRTLSLEISTNEKQK